MKATAGDFLEGLRHIFHSKLWFRQPSARLTFTTFKCAAVCGAGHGQGGRERTASLHESNNRK